MWTAFRLLFLFGSTEGRGRAEGQSSKEKIRDRKKKDARGEGGRWWTDRRLLEGTEGRCKEEKIKNSAFVDPRATEMASRPHRPRRPHIHIHHPCKAAGQVVTWEEARTNPKDDGFTLTWSVATTRRNGPLNNSNIPSDQTFSEAGSSSLKENCAFEQLVHLKGLLLPFSTMNKAIRSMSIMGMSQVKYEQRVCKLMDQWGWAMNKHTLTVLTIQ